METVKVNKAVLLNAIKANRENHKAQFDTAMVGFTKEAMRVLQLNLDALARGSKARVLVNETPPEDHTKDYDRAIRMLEMCVDSELEISQHDFAQYVMDDWGWKQAWTVSNSKYGVAP